MSSNPQTDGRRSTSTWQALTHGRTLFSILMFGIFTTMVLIASTYTFPANFLPYVIGIPGIALTALQVLLDVLNFHKSKGKIDPRTDFERYMDDISKHTGGKVQMELKEGTKLQTLVDDHTDMTKGRNRREIILLGYFFMLLIMVLLFGFWIGYPIFMALFLHYYSRETWKLTGYLTVGSWLVMYGILVVVLEQILFEGFVVNYITDNWLPD